MRYLKKDIYDKEGKLLLAAGHALTEKMVKKLEKLDINIHDYLHSNNICEDMFKDISDAENISDQLRKNIDISNNRIFDFSSNVVINIIYNSRNMPWWLHVNTLCSYVDWLYSHILLTLLLFQL